MHYFRCRWRWVRLTMMGLIKQFSTDTKTQDPKRRKLSSSLSGKKLGFLSILISQCHQLTANNKPLLQTFYDDSCYEWFCLHASKQVILRQHFSMTAVKNWFCLLKNGFFYRCCFGSLQCYLMPDVNCIFMSRWFEIFKISEKLFFGGDPYDQKRQACITEYNSAGKW